MINAKPMKKRIYAICVLALLVVGGCSGSKSNANDSSGGSDKEELIETLTLFVEAVQGDRFEKAFTYLTPSERAKMSDASGQASPMIRRQLKALRLSTLAQKSGVRIENEKLEGIFEWLPLIQSGPPQAIPDPETPLIQ
jgi:hypothetical protein